jgi:hypothetical protein
MDTAFRREPVLDERAIKALALATRRACVR